MHLCVRWGRHRVLSFLTQTRNFGTNVKDHRRRSPLHLAAQLDRCECLRVLIGARASIRSKDASGDRPVHSAARAGAAHCLRMLLESRASANERGRGGLVILPRAP